ncbi:MAG: hypothetical protein WCX95_05010 [Candidatus Gracilibacteria bacterium]
MKTYAPSELLSPGDIFDETTEAGEESPENQVSYLVMDVQAACMRVAELGGENRNDRIVLAKDMPEPGSFNKWRFSKKLAGLRGDYVDRVLSILRESLPDLRTLEGMEGAYTTLEDIDADEVGQRNFSSYVKLGKNGLFGQVAYGFGRGRSVCPTLRDFDVKRFGIIPERYKVRGDEEAYTADVWDLALDQRGANAIKAIADGNGILMAPDSYIGYPVFPNSWHDRAVTGIEGYLPGEEPGRAKHFPDVKSAHSAVLKAHQNSTES